MTVITTRNKPRRSIVKDMTAQNSVRAYRHSPEDIMLQLRREKDYVGIALTFDEVRTLIVALEVALPENEERAA